MPSIAIAALGALLVAFVYEVNPKVGGPLLVLVVMALLLAAYKARDLQSAGALGFAKNFVPPTIIMSPGVGSGGG